MLINQQINIRPCPMPNILYTVCNLHIHIHTHTYIHSYVGTHADMFVQAGEHLSSECDKNVAKMCYMRGIFNFQLKPTGSQLGGCATLLSDQRSQRTIRVTCNVQITFKFKWTTKANINQVMFMRVCGM